MIQRDMAIVGLGGAGGWLLQLLMKSERSDTCLWLVDGDKLTRENLNRQLYLPKHVGMTKVEAASDILRKAPLGEIATYPGYLAYGNPVYLDLLAGAEPLTVFCCVDNHPARRVVLTLADERHEEHRETQVFITGNEYETASAQAYMPRWRDTALDIRVMFPEILTSNDNDPLHPPCSGEALESAPQLALSNAISALSAAWLERFWSEKAEVLRGQCTSAQEQTALARTFPVLVDWTSGRQRTLTAGQILGE